MLEKKYAPLCSFAFPVGWTHQCYYQSRAEANVATSIAARIVQVAIEHASICAVVPVTAADGKSNATAVWHIPFFILGFGA